MGIFTGFLSSTDKELNNIDTSIENPNDTEGVKNEDVQDNIDAVNNNVGNDTDIDNTNNEANDNRDNAEDKVLNENEQSNKFKIDFNGNEVELSQDEVIELAKNYLNSQQIIDEYKKNLDLIKASKEANIDKELLLAVIDAAKGNEDARKYLIKKFAKEDEVLLDDDFNVDYKPNTNINNDFEFINEYYKKSNPKLFENAIATLNTLPDDFKLELTKDANVYNAFINSIANEEFQKIYPEAIKIKAINPSLSWLDAYSQAYNNFNVSVQQINNKNIHNKTVGSFEVDKITDDKNIDYNSMSFDELAKLIWG